MQIATKILRLNQALRLAGLALGIAQAGLGYGTTYVSRLGADGPSCGINVAPCYSLQAALVNTDNGGTVKILDGNAVAPSGIVISRPVTIDGSGMGVIENIFSPGSPAVLVSANCTLRNLVIQVTSGDGVLVSAANVQVNVENVQIQGSASFVNGIHVTGAGVNLSVAQLTVNGAATGVNFGGASGIFTGTGLRIQASSIAAIAMTGGSGTLRHSLLAGKSSGGASVGLYVSGASFTVDDCESTANATGIVADGAAQVRIGASVIAGNATGLAVTNGGQIVSLRTNSIGGNGADGTPPLSSSLK